MSDWCNFAVQNKCPIGTGSYLANVPRRGVLHTTESESFTPSPSKYFGHDSWPHFTVAQRYGHWVVYQHIPVSRPARALMNLSGGVETNRQGAIQIEITWFAKNAASWPEQLYEAVATLMNWIEANTGVAHHSTGMQFGGNEQYGRNNVYEMDSSTWKTFNGWCGHQHVPENSHWDPGAIDIDRLLRWFEQAPPPDQGGGPIVASNNTAVAFLNTPEGDGGWVLMEDGSIWSLGNAQYCNDLSGQPYAVAGDVATSLVAPKDGQWGYTILTKASPKDGYTYTGTPMPPVNQVAGSADASTEAALKHAQQQLVQVAALVNDIEKVLAS